MFKEKTSLAIEGEVRSLLLKKTLSGVDVSTWGSGQKEEDSALYNEHRGKVSSYIGRQLEQKCKQGQGTSVR
jgi:hypothetical protein